MLDSFSNLISWHRSNIDVQEQRHAHAHSHGYEYKPSVDVQMPTEKSKDCNSHQHAPKVQPALYERSQSHRANWMIHGPSAHESLVVEAKETECDFIFLVTSHVLFDGLTGENFKLSRDGVFLHLEVESSPEPIIKLNHHGAQQFSFKINRWIWLPRHADESKSTCRWDTHKQILSIIVPKTTPAMRSHHARSANKTQPQVDSPVEFPINIAT
jgi:hypothetical protein